MIYLNHQGLGECASYLRQSHRQWFGRCHSELAELLTNHGGGVHNPKLNGALFPIELALNTVLLLPKKRTASELNLATHKAFSTIPPEFIQTFTFDGW